MAKKSRFPPQKIGLQLLLIKIARFSRWCRKNPSILTCSRAPFARATSSAPATTTPATAPPRGGTPSTGGRRTSRGSSGGRRTGRQQSCSGGQVTLSSIKWFGKSQHYTSFFPLLVCTSDVGKSDQPWGETMHFIWAHGQVPEIKKVFYTIQF